MSFARAAMAVLVATASSSPAHADTSYRGTTAIADLMGGAAFAGGIELGTDTSIGLALTVGGLTVAGLGAPVLHGAHGNPGRMAASFLLRVTLPPLGAYGGYLLSPQNNAKFRHGGGLLGFMAGYAVVTIIDIAMAKTSDDPTTEARVLSLGGRF